MFVDKAEIKIKSGKGGNGAVSFRREPFVPDGGPDGGNGGKGGNVVFKSDNSIRTLMDFKYKTKYNAENGQDGMGKKRYGKDGSDLIIKVPVGTVIVDKENDQIMADLSDDKEEYIAALGGKGGKGNTEFKNSVRQAPNFAESGSDAQERTVILELKLIADVGLIGFPNVGKSTLLSASTRAKPKIANYHFTTLHPNLGVVQLANTSFVMADIPGLIEGAHTGAGLGLDFLKHIERTKILLHVVDVSGSEGRDPIDDYEKINIEMDSFSKELNNKPQIVACNKTDLLFEGNDEYERYKEFLGYLDKNEVKHFDISAATGEGVKDLLNYLAKELYQISQEPELDTGITFDVRPIEEDPDYRIINIDQSGNEFYLTGKQLKKIFDSTNFNDSGSLRYLYKYIEKNGAIDKMKEMGLTDGDTINVYDYELEYYDE